MTTNSPYPVDGDVQALIADCQQEIDSLKWKINRTRKSGGTLVYMESCLKRQQIALAALTAEPVYQFIVNNPDKDGYIEWADCNPDYFSKEPKDSRRILYTTTPAQLLRPVELPIKRRPWSCADSDNVLDYQETVTALRNQGYEVKL